MTREIVCYVLVRNDLPSLNPGKAAAQIHHAAVQMAVKHHSDDMFQEYVSTGIAAGADTFNTTVTVSASLAEIERACARLANAKCLFGLVIDPEYPFLVDAELRQFLQDTKLKYVKSVNPTQDLYVREELTCAWCLIYKDDIVAQSAVDTLPLMR